MNTGIYDIVSPINARSFTIPSRCGLRDYEIFANSFDPRSIPGIAVWYDAADETSILLGGLDTAFRDRNNISVWRDKSGNRRNATQTTAINQPAYILSKYNGKNVINFPAGTRSFDCSVPLASENTIFCVTTKTSSFNCFITYAVPNGGPSFISNYGPGDFEYYTFSDRILMAGNGATNGLVLLTASQIDSSRLVVYLNGKEVGSKASPSTNWRNSTLTKINLQNFVGDFAEYIIYHRVLTTAERNLVTRYLGVKWGGIAS